MLKSTFAPIFSHFPPKPRRRIKTSSFRLISGITTESPPDVRRNAPLKKLTSTILEPPRSAYVHLPFCRKRCHYCDFPIVALGSSTNSKQPPEDDPRIVNYINILSREIGATRRTAAEFETRPPPLETVFFGGGTPSLVPPRLVQSVLELVKGKFEVSFDAEISMEMDPGTFDAKKMQELLELGVNRVSLGVQAFQDQLLSACGRAHGVKEIDEAIEIVKSCGVGNWSMDLISSLPHQTHEMWEQSLRLAIESHPPHLSVYDLQVEQGTKFNTLYTPGEFPLPSDTQCADFYKTASAMLSGAGYNHYEISSYGLDGFECKHNQTYWNNLPFYAFGLGSTSYINGVRFSRPRKMKEYTDYVQRLEEEEGEEELLGESASSSSSVVVDVTELATDVVMLSLRTARGLDMQCFRETFGDSPCVSLCRVYLPYVGSGHVICMDSERRPMTADELNALVINEDDDEIRKRLAFIRLSDPEGFLLSNELISLAFGAIAP